MWQIYGNLVFQHIQSLDGVGEEIVNLYTATLSSGLKCLIWEFFPVVPTNTI